uniref:Uncharacterized protein n=1 Tax=Avena sativa TaxID=4498 RepID=A0ACD6ACZ3_AVESA
MEICSTMEICTTTPSSPPPVDVVVLSDTDSDDDDDSSTLSRPAAERVTSSLCTQAEVDALCEKHGVPREFAARPAGDRRACMPPRPGAVCVYAHALEAGLRFPLHPFFSEALAHFCIAPGQLTPNGWRVLLGFFVLCHSAAVPPSVAVFRHFFSLPSRKGWYGFKCKKGAGVLFTGLTSAKSEKDWKRGFFFLTSPEPWLCPVRWGQPPSTISAASPALSSEDKKSVAKLVHLHSSSVDLRTYLSETDLAAVFSSNFTSASPLLDNHVSYTYWNCSPNRYEAVAPAGKVKAEPDGETTQFFSRKKRKLEEVASAKDGLGRSELNAPPGWRAPPGPDASPRHSPVPDAHDGDSADWEESRKVLECIVTPARERAFAVAKPSDIVMSTYVAMHQVANYTVFSLRYAQELEEKQTAHEREVAALREQLEEAKAEKQAAEAKLEKARAEVEAARRATEAQVESAKATAVQQFLGSKEYTRRVAEQALAAYEDGAEEMKRVALRVNPRLDAAKLVLSP